MSAVARGRAACTASSTPATTRRSRCSGVSLERRRPASSSPSPGPSGSGKSTLLACLAGLDEPDGGMVRVDGERLSRRPEERARARCAPARIGVLYQQANLVGHLSVADNVALAQRLGGGADAGAARRDVLERCGDRAPRRTPGPSQLSGGELARAGLAVALANDPAVLLADEPTGELDDVTAERVLDAAARARRRRARPCSSSPTAPEVAARRRPRDPPARRAGRRMSVARRSSLPRRRRAPTAAGATATVALQPDRLRGRRRARGSRSSARPARASRRCCTCSPGSTSRRSARSPGRRSATARSCARARSPSSSRARACCRR